MSSTAGTLSLQTLAETTQAPVAPFELELPVMKTLTVAAPTDSLRAAVAAGKISPGPGRGTGLAIEAVLSWLPGERLTARARWQGTTVLAKLFFAPGQWPRHYSAELKGLGTLAAADIPVPELVQQLYLEHGGILLLEYLAAGQTLGELLTTAATTCRTRATGHNSTRTAEHSPTRAAEHSPTRATRHDTTRAGRAAGRRASKTARHRATRAAERRGGPAAQQQTITPPLALAMLQAVIAIARGHLHALWDIEMRLTNFMLHQGKVYVLDGRTVQPFAEPLNSAATRERALDNLAMFYAQFPATLDQQLASQRADQLGSYQTITGLTVDLVVFQETIELARYVWLRWYQDRLLRPGSTWCVTRHADYFAVYQRTLDSPQLQALMANPDRFIKGRPPAQHARQQHDHGSRSNAGGPALCAQTL